MDIVRVIVFLPEESRERIMDAVNSVMKPIYPSYDFVFSWSNVTGCWRPLSGANPFIGSIGEICYANEIRLEFCCYRDSLKKVIQTVKALHPYEEPVIDVVNVETWKNFIGCDV